MALAGALAANNGGVDQAGPATRVTGLAASSPQNQRNEVAAINRAALKKIRKLSDWFKKHHNFRAVNMRHRLGELLNASHGETYLQSQSAQQKEEKKRPNNKSTKNQQKTGADPKSGK